MDKETETTINRLLADNKAAHDLSDYLINENKRLRVVVEDAVAWCERHDKEPYWLADARAALKEGE